MKDMSSQASKADGKKDITGRSVYVSGQNRFRNELLAFYLNKEIGLQCNIREGPFKPDKKYYKNSGKDEMILIECPEKDIQTFLKELEGDKAHITNRHLVALFNVEQGLGI